MTIKVYSSGDHYKYLSLLIYECKSLEYVSNVLDADICFLYIKNIDFRSNDKFNKYLDGLEAIGDLPFVHICYDETGRSEKKFDKRHDYLRSSIWHRLLFVSNCSIDEEQVEILKELKDYNEYGVYEQYSAIEHRDFHLELCRISTIEAKESDSEHGKYISPFPFHSEPDFSLKNEQYKDLSGIKWNILWIDDKFNDGNDEVKKCKHKTAWGPECKSCDAWKCRIVQEHFNKVGASCSIKRTGTVNGAISSMRDNRYDIIVLDYLLGESDVPGEREYGTELLEKLNNQNGLLKGPYGRFWIFPASAFSYSMLEDIQNKDMQLISDKWYISRGADPVNTPHLFRYKLREFLNLQIKEARFIEIYKCIVSIRSEFFSKKTKSKIKRKHFVNLYELLLTLGSKEDYFKKEEYKESEFQKTFFGKKFKAPYFAHLLDMLYFSAYGSDVEWAELQDEYHTVMSILESNSSNGDHIVSQRDKCIKELLLVIEKLIAIRYTNTLE